MPGALSPRRRHVDTLTSGIVGLGGATVVGAIVMIFCYLVWVVTPIFTSATIGKPSSYGWMPGPTRLLASNDTGELVLRITASGGVDFLERPTGQTSPGLEIGSPVRLARTVSGTENLYGALDDSGGLSFLQVSYPVAFDGASRRVMGLVQTAFDETRIDLGPVTDFDAYFDGSDLTIATLSGRRLVVRRYADAEPDYPLADPEVTIRTLDADFERIWLGPRGESTYLVSMTGAVQLIALPKFGPPSTIARASLVSGDSSISAVAPLLGRISLLVADGTRLSQWFPVRRDGTTTLERIREFPLPAPAVAIVAEQRRKGFGVLDETGGLHLFYTTAPSVLASRRLEDPPSVPAAITFAPRADALFAQSRDGILSAYPVQNPYPEISWNALWRKVWYEGYEDPVYSWQSSSADNDFEPKFSLVPLLFGTLKAAFYAMLFALPLAVMGAVYTGYFMAPAMRSLVKPGIEILAALPTVVLGFLAGLWLAPLIESNLASVLTIFWALPLCVLAVSVLWGILPDGLRKRLAGWYGLLMLPVIVVSVGVAFESGPALEAQFFGGNAHAWLLDNLGLGYDQRNALVVGIAMGIAIVPTIFSISEDAIQGVPARLVNASLALGATRWQTLLRVVLLAASPGIFSGMIIGFGRAVGETMIVLMATGNTPIMDWNIFEGMRTLAANIAVELPESEVGSSHYRLLFLTALVLFGITFVFNTVAELIRHRLRERYGRP